MQAPVKVSRYDVLEKIAESGFSVVYRGRDSLTQRPVAIKICVATDAALRQRFLRLAELAAPLRHPNIVEVLEFGSGDGKPYLIEEYLPGDDLRSRLGNRQPAPSQADLELLVDVARALQYAHRKGVLHEDLKPATVHLEEGGRIKLVDFGLARLATAAARLASPTSLPVGGSYLPPEQALGLPADRRADVYCFGALAYELFTGGPPPLAGGVHDREGSELTTAWKECPPALAALVQRCLARSPGDRFASFDEVLEELLPLVRTKKRSVRLEDTAPAPPPPSLDDTMAIPPEVGAAILPKPVPGDRGDETSHSGELVPPVVVAPPAPPQPPPAPALPSPALQAPVARAEVAPLLVEPVKLSPLSPAVKPPPAAAAPLRPAAPRPRPRRMPWVMLALIGIAGIAALALLLAGGSPDSAPVAAPPPPKAAAPAPKPAAAVAPAVAEGLLLIDAQPWAEVVRVTDEAGRELPLPALRSTPLSLSVSPGRYRAELRHPGRAESAHCETSLPPHGTALCTATVVEIDAKAYFKEAGWWR